MNMKEFVNLSCLKKLYSAQQRQGMWHVRDEDKFIQHLDGKPEEKTQLARPKRLWKDNIKMDLQNKTWAWAGLI